MFPSHRSSMSHGTDLLFPLSYQSLHTNSQGARETNVLHPYININTGVRICVFAWHITRAFIVWATNCSCEKDCECCFERSHVYIYDISDCFRIVPSCWAFIIHVKRRLPRWTMFPIVFLLTVAVSTRLTSSFCLMCEISRIIRKLQDCLLKKI